MSIRLCIIIFKKSTLKRRHLKSEVQKSAVLSVTIMLNVKPPAEILHVFKSVKSIYKSSTMI